MVFSLLVFQPSAASAYSGDIYMSSFQNIDWTKYLTGEIHYNFSSGPSSPTYYSYCVNRSASLPVPGSYHAETSSIAGDYSYLKAAWLIDNYAASKTYSDLSSSPALNDGVALQLAIWEQIGQGIEYNSIYAGYENIFNQKDYLDNLVNGVTTEELDSLALKYQIIRINTIDGQGHLQDIESLTPVPLPSAIFLFGPGLLLLFGKRKILLPAI